ncbi:hypothetical protein ES703_10446 [subsurface metagenome]
MKIILNLEIKPKDLKKNILALFEEMDKDDKLRESFIHNPTGHITAKVMKRKLPPQQISEANRLLFSLISNDEMIKWLNNYNIEQKDKEMDKKQFVIDFANKIKELGDQNIIVSIISNAAFNNGIPGLSDVAYQCVCNETPNKNSCACTPVAKDSIPVDLNINPGLLRSITEHLISYAKDLSNTGQLLDLTIQIH